MKFSVIQTIEISSFKKEALEEQLLKSHCSLAPSLLYLDPPQGQSLIIGVELLKEAFLKLNISPVFPYPSYLLKEYSLNQDFFPTLDSFDRFPSHFLDKIKRLKKIEEDLHNKTTTSVDRISNHPINQDMKYLSEKAKKNQLLRDLLMEKSFYTEIYQSLKNNRDQEV